MVKPHGTGRLGRHKLLQRGVDGGLHLGLHRRIHEALGRAPHQLHALFQNVQRHGDGRHRIQPQPPGQGRARNAHQHTSRGPHVGDQVAGIGLQRDGAVLARRAEHHPGQQPVQGRAEHRQAQAPAHLRDGLRVEQAVPGCPQDACRHAHDEDALEPRRKVFGLVVAVGVVVIGRALRHRHHGQRKHGAGQVHKRLHRVRQQTHRARDHPGQRLERNGDYRHGHRGPQQVAG